jgi:hypothetical protein
MDGGERKAGIILTYIPATRLSPDKNWTTR